MPRLLVLVTAGLSPSILRGADAPNLLRLGGGRVRALRPVFPALTAPAQASLLTGVDPAHHGIVGNGWFDRDRMDLEFWPHGAGLVEAERVSARLRRRRPGATTAAAFLWNLLGSDLDAYVNVNPLTPVGGGKMVFSCYGKPADLNERVEARLGPFPLDRYWGPRTDVSSTRWIAEAAKEILRAHAPTLLYVYLSHLDYRPQSHGPAAPEVGADLRALDEVVGDLVGEAAASGMRTVALSEYGIRPVSGAVEPNRALRRAGYLAIRSIGGRDYVDWGNARAFAVTDHQVAHVYVRDPADRAPVARLLGALPGVARVLDEEGKREMGIAHRRAGDLVLLSAPDRWFAYPFWEEAARAPDYARAIEIHRKPGYDPLEMVFDPAAGGISWDTSRVRGSHGLVPDEPDHMGVLLGDALAGVEAGEGPVDFLDAARAIEDEAARP